MINTKRMRRLVYILQAASALVILNSIGLLVVSVLWVPNLFVEGVLVGVIIGNAVIFISQLAQHKRITRIEELQVLAQVFETYRLTDADIQERP